MSTEPSYQLLSESRPSRCRWALAHWILSGFVFLAVFAPFLANDQPILAKIEGSWISPMLSDRSYKDIDRTAQSWYDIDYELVIWPLVPFHATTIIRDEPSYLSPGSSSQLADQDFSHYMGTDQIGRDVTAALIHGTRLALIVALLACFIAFGIGIALGLMMGYWADGGIRFAVYKQIIFAVLAMLAFFYLAYANTVNSSVLYLVIFIISAIVISRLPDFGKVSSIPIDSIGMRIIEVIRAIPNLLILLVLLSILESTSIYTVAIVIGLLGWPNVARLVRGEVLNIKKKEYVLAAEMMRFSTSNILFKQLLPNILAPIYIALAYSISSVVIAEATLSFLGIGVSPDQISWGTLLSGARDNIQAWWLAVFPGICILLVVMSTNYIGDQQLRQD